MSTESADCKYYCIQLSLALIITDFVFHAFKDHFNIFLQTFAVQVISGSNHIWIIGLYSQDP